MKIDSSSELAPCLTPVFQGASQLFALNYWMPEQRLPVDSMHQALPPRLMQELDLRKLVGLEEKRICDPAMSVLQMAINATDRLLAHGTFDGSAIDKNDINLVIFFSISKECTEPATAVFIQEHLALKQTMAFDISDACLGFTDAWMIADSMIAAGRIKNALLVAAERLSPTSNASLEAIVRGGHPRDYFSGMTLGDGAVAALVGPVDTERKGFRLVSGIRQTFSPYNDLCVIPEKDEAMVTRSQRMISVSLNYLPLLTQPVLERIGLKSSDMDVLLCHQVSVPAIEKGTKLLDMQGKTVTVTFEKFGNVASVSVPLTIAKYVEENADWFGKKILMAAFGSGLGAGIFALQT